MQESDRRIFPANVLYSTVCIHQYMSVEQAYPLEGVNSHKSPCRPTPFFRKGDISEIVICPHSALVQRHRAKPKILQGVSPGWGGWRAYTATNGKLRAEFFSGACRVPVTPTKPLASEILSKGGNQCGENRVPVEDKDPLVTTATPARLSFPLKTPKLSDMGQSGKAGVGPDGKST